jgi:hypothetical protein
MKYLLEMKLLDKYEFVGIIYFNKNGNLIIEPIIDKENYTFTLYEFWKAGDIKIKQIKEYDYEIKIKKFNFLEEFFNILKEIGFDISYQKLKEENGLSRC